MAEYCTNDLSILLADYLMLELTVLRYRKNRYINYANWLVVLPGIIIVTEVVVCDAVVVLKIVRHGLELIISINLYL